jgi:biopolymer transport protein ExbD
MKRVRGFITDDNQFFVEQTEARLHELTQNIEEIMLQDNVDYNKLIQILGQHTVAIKEYINALEKHRARRGQADPDQEQAPPV